MVFSSVVEDLKKMPAPEVAVKYYTSSDMYLFGKFCLFFNLCLYLERQQRRLNIPPKFYADEFQTSRPPNSRRPKIGKSSESDFLMAVHTSTCL